MREIIFKGKRIIAKVGFYGCLILSSTSGSKTIMGLYLFGSILWLARYNYLLWKEYK